MADDSVVFDQAAGFYDRTRGLPAGTEAAQTDLLAAELAPVSGPVLEVGVGTGRIAVPLARAGIRVAGVDLSAPMLAVLAGKDSAVRAVRGSALALPVGTSAVGAAICCHVLHLIRDWRQAVAEIQRVLRPGGLLLAARGGRPSGLGGELQRRIQAAAGLPPGSTPGLDDLTVLDEHLAGCGARVRLLPEIASLGSWTVSAFLRAAERNTYSWTWPMDPGRRADAVAQARDWVTRAHGDPDELRMTAAPIRWHAYRLP